MGDLNKTYNVLKRLQVKIFPVNEEHGTMGYSFIIRGRLIRSAIIFFTQKVMNLWVFYLQACGCLNCVHSKRINRWTSMVCGIVLKSSEVEDQTCSLENGRAHSKDKVTYFLLRFLMFLLHLITYQNIWMRCMLLDVFSIVYQSLC